MKIGIKNKLEAADNSGFTLPEVLIASAISVMVISMVIGFFVSTLSYWRKISATIDADNEADMALRHITLGGGGRLGLRNAVASSFRLDDEDDGWHIEYITASDPVQTNLVVFSEADRTLTFEPGSQNIATGVLTAQVSRVPASNPFGLEIKVTIQAQDGSKTATRYSETMVLFRN